MLSKLHLYLEKISYRLILIFLVEPLKKQLEQSTNSKFVVIVGPDEFSKNMVVVRNMSDRNENQILISELLEHIKNILM